MDHHVCNHLHKRKLVLIRHGGSIWSKENRFTGWHDVDLTNEGRAQAKRGGEVSKDSGERFLPLWQETIAPQMTEAESSS